LAAESTKKLAVLSDIHGNIRSLDAVLHDIERMFPLVK